MAAPSLLNTVAQHEHRLMARIEQAEAAARQATEDARTDAATHLQESRRAVEAEVAALRREAASARESERSVIEREAASKAEAIRQQTAGRLDPVRDEILEMILPRSTEGG